MLFVHDPKAIHHISVKEVEIYEEATWFTRLVLVYILRVLYF